MNETSQVPPLRSLPPGRAPAIRRMLVEEVSPPAHAARPLRRPLGWAVVAAALLAGAVGGGLVLFGNVGTAAAWTPVPDTVPAAATARLGQACAQTIAAARLPMTLAGPRPILAERRGAFQSVLVAGAADRTAICVAQSADHGSGSSSWGFSGIYQLEPNGGLLTVDAVAGQIGGAGATRVAFGRVAPQVTAVTIHTADGRTVTASLGQGRYLAWWPSGAGVTNVQALDGSGRVLATVTQPAEPRSVTPTQG